MGRFESFSLIGFVYGTADINVAKNRAMPVIGHQSPASCAQVYQHTVFDFPPPPAHILRAWQQNRLVVERLMLHWQTVSDDSPCRGRKSLPVES